MLRISCSPRFRRRELTPVRLYSVRLSWRQRARPSTTLHEIQICRSRLEYFVCTTACEGPQLMGAVNAEVVSTRLRGDGCTGRVQEGSMKRYLKFAASFWVSAFLVAGSMAPAQTSVTPKAKKKAGSSTTNATTTPAPTTDTTGSTQTDNATTAPSSDPSTTTPP